MSDYPKFDAAYDAMLIPEDADRFNHLAAQTRFNIYNSPIWREQGQLFSRAVIQDCVQTLRSNGYDDAAQCLQDIHFGLDHPV